MVVIHRSMGRPFSVSVHQRRGSRDVGNIGEMSMQSGHFVCVFNECLCLDTEHNILSHISRTRGVIFRILSHGNMNGLHDCNNANRLL